MKAKVLFRLLQSLLSGIALVAAVRPRVVREVRVEATQPQPTAPGVNYRQLRHLIVGGIFLVLAIWLFFWFADKTQQVLAVVTVSVLLAVALRPTVDRMCRWAIPPWGWRIPRALAIFLIYLFVALILVGVGFAVVPPLIVEFQNLIANLPNYLNALNNALEGLRNLPFLSSLGGIQGQVINQIVASVSGAFNVVSVAVNALTALLSIGVVLVVTFFLIYDADRIYYHFTSLLSPRAQERAVVVTERMGRKVEGWLRGILLLAIILGGVTTAVMYALAMPYPYLLGLAAGLFELVPIIGPYLGAAPAGAIALFTQPLWKFIAVVVYFFLIQQIENNILAPKIFGGQAEIPPLVVILALLIGGSIYGILGALVAVPIAAILEVLWNEVVAPNIRRRTHEEEEEA